MVEEDCDDQGGSTDGRSRSSRRSGGVSLLAACRPTPRGAGASARGRPGVGFLGVDLSGHCAGTFKPTRRPRSPTCGPGVVRAHRGVALRRYPRRPASGTIPQAARPDGAVRTGAEIAPGYDRSGVHDVHTRSACPRHAARSGTACRASERGDETFRTSASAAVSAGSTRLGASEPPSGRGRDADGGFCAHSTVALHTMSLAWRVGPVRQAAGRGSVSGCLFW